MAESSLTDYQSGWTCQRCSTWNSPDHTNFNCTQCGKNKPYDTGASAFLNMEAWVSEEEVTTSTESTSQRGPDVQASSSFRLPSPGHGDRREITQRSFQEKSWERTQCSFEEEKLDFPVKECRLVLLGKTGSGKSSTGNTILGGPKFDVGHSSKSKTTQSWWMYAERFGIKLEIVDSPGLFDTNIDDVSVSKEIAKSVGCVAPGPHALLFVVRSDVKFTKEEAEAVEHIRKMFGDDITRHFIIVFTHGDQYNSYQEFQHVFLQDPEPALASLLEEADNRLVLFNNKESDFRRNQDQVKRLLKTVRGLLAHTDNKSFENPILLRCRETVLSNTEKLAEKLGKALPRESAGDLLRAGFMGKDNAEKLLHEVLDRESQDSAEVDWWKETFEKLLIIMGQKDLAMAELQEELGEAREQLIAKEKEELKNLRGKEKLKNLPGKEKRQEQPIAKKEKTSRCAIL